MPGTYQYDVEIKSNVAKLLSDMKQVQDRLDTIEGKEYKIKLNVDEKKLSSAISNLEKMLDSLGKGTGDFKQFENLSKELSSIVSEVQSLSKAFGKVDDSGAKTLLSSIQNIDNSLSELSQNILNVNKNMSNMGGNTSGAVKEIENITNESKQAAKALDDVAKAQAKVNGSKTNISSGSTTATEQQNKLQEELKETRKEAEETAKAINSVSNPNIKQYNNNVKFGLDRVKKAQILRENGIAPGRDLLLTDKGIWSELKKSGFLKPDMSSLSEEEIRTACNDWGDALVSKISEYVSQKIRNAGFKDDFEFTDQLYDIENAKHSNWEHSSNNIGWTFFNTKGYKNVSKDEKAFDYKIYAAFEDVAKLNKETIQMLFKALSEAGYVGGLKTARLSDSAGQTDQIVLHGRNAKDQEIAYRVLQEFSNQTGIKLGYLGGGFDTTRNGTKINLGDEVFSTTKGRSFSAMIEQGLDEYLARFFKITSSFTQENSTSSLNSTSSGIEEQNKLQEELRETEVQAGQTAQAVREVTSQDQMKDAFPSTDTKLDEAVTSEYSKMVSIQQKRDVEDYNANAKANLDNAKNIQAAWDKNVQAIQNYMNAVTELNNLKAKDKGTGNEASQIELQTKNVEELKQAAYEARQTLSSMINPHDTDISTWDKWLDIMKQFDQASLGSAESVAKLEDALRNANEAQNKYINSVVNKQNGYLNDYQTASSKEGFVSTDTFKEKIANYEIEVSKLNNLAEQLSQQDFVTKDQQNQFEDLKQHCEDARKALTKMSASDKGAWAVDIQKEIDKINSDLMKNTNYSKEAKQQLNAFIEQLEAGNISDTTLKEIHNRFLEITNAEKLAGREGKNFFDILSNSRVHQIASQIAGMFSFYDLVNGVKQVFSTVRELDTAYTEMRKVSDESAQSLKNFQKESFSTADAVGTTALALQDATATWMRLGESLEQAKESAKDATVLLNVSEFDNIDEATDSLVAMSQAYKDLDKMEIIDVLDEVGNKYSISTDQLSTALKDSAAVLKTQGNDLAESVALITAGNAITQDASKTAGETLPERYRNIFL